MAGCYGSLNFAAHSPEDKQRGRRRRSAHLRQTGLKGLSQYRTAGMRAVAGRMVVTPTNMNSYRSARDVGWLPTYEWDMRYAQQGG
jgi:hypothetical protein